MDWQLRDVPAQLRARYLADGHWTDDSFAGFIEREVAAAPSLSFRVWSETHPFAGTTGGLYEQSLRIATGLSRRGVGVGDVVAYQLPNWGLPYQRPALEMRDHLEVLNAALRGPGSVDVERCSATRSSARTTSACSTRATPKTSATSSRQATSRRSSSGSAPSRTPAPPTSRSAPSQSARTAARLESRRRTLEFLSSLCPEL
jgi:hypothetical protein